MASPGGAHPDTTVTDAGLTMLVEPTQDQALWSLIDSYHQQINLSNASQHASLPELHSNNVNTDSRASRLSAHMTSLGVQYKFDDAKTKPSRTPSPLRPPVEFSPPRPIRQKSALTASTSELPLQMHARLKSATCETENDARQRRQTRRSHEKSASYDVNLSRGGYIASLIQHGIAGGSHTSSPSVASAASVSTMALKHIVSELESTQRHEGSAEQQADHSSRSRVPSITLTLPKSRVASPALFQPILTKSPTSPRRSPISTDTTSHSPSPTMLNEQFNPNSQTQRESPQPIVVIGDALWPQATTPRTTTTASPLPHENSHLGEDPSAFGRHHDLVSPRNHPLGFSRVSSQPCTPLSSTRFESTNNTSAQSTPLHPAAHKFSNKFANRNSGDFSSLSFQPDELSTPDKHTASRTPSRRSSILTRFMNGGSDPSDQSAPLMSTPSDAKNTPPLLTAEAIWREALHETSTDVTTRRRMSLLRNRTLAQSESQFGSHYSTSILPSTIGQARSTGVHSPLSGDLRSATRRATIITSGSTQASIEELELNADAPVRLTRAHTDDARFVRPSTESENSSVIDPPHTPATNTPSNTSNQTAGKTTILGSLRSRLGSRRGSTTAITYPLHFGLRNDDMHGDITDSLDSHNMEAELSLDLMEQCENDQHNGWQSQPGTRLLEARGSFLSVDNDDDEDDAAMDFQGDDQLMHAYDSAVSGGIPPSHNYHAVMRFPRNKREQIVREIVLTERSYVSGLAILQNVFVKRLQERRRVNGQPITTAAVIQRIFSNSRQIYLAHRQFLLCLHVLVSTWEDNSGIADAFVELIPQLHMYATYTSGFDQAIQTLSDWLTHDAEFAHIVAECEALPVCHSLSLSAFLLEPIQRIPRYRLLLNEYLASCQLGAHAAVSEHEISSIRQSIEGIGSVATYINNSITPANCQPALITLQHMLIGVNILKPGRQVIKSGKLAKLSGATTHPRSVWVFNDAILYATEKTIITTQYIHPHLIEMSQVQAIRDSALHGSNNSIQIITASKSYVFLARNVSEHVDWMEALFDARAEYNLHKPVQSHPMSPHPHTSFGTTAQSNDEKQLGRFCSVAPMWIADGGVSMCMVCTQPFSLLRRRHHCRACGKVVCDDCSKARVQLAYMDDRLGRVCPLCYADYLEMRSTSSPATPPTPLASPSPNTDTTLTPRSAENKHGSDRIGSGTALMFMRRADMVKTKQIKQGHVLLKAKGDDASAMCDVVLATYLYRLHSSLLRTWSKLWCVVKENYCLYIYKAPEDVLAMQAVPLPGMTITVLPVKSGISRMHAFQLTQPKSQPIIFAAESASTLSMWIDTLKAASSLQLL